MGTFGKVALPLLVVIVLLSVLLGLPDHLNPEGLQVVSDYLSEGRTETALDSVVSLSIMTTGAQIVTSHYDVTAQQSIILGRPPANSTHGAERVYGYWYCTAPTDGATITDAYLIYSPPTESDLPFDSYPSSHWALKCLSSFAHSSTESESWTDAITAPFRYLVNYARAIFGWFSIGGWYILDAGQEMLRILNALAYLCGFRIAL